MVEVIVLDRAQEDLIEIAEYWGRFSVKSVRIHLDKIYQKIELLKTFPRLGKVYQDLDNPNVREISAGAYRVFYHIVSAQKIHILAVHHSASPFDWEELHPN